MRDQQRTVGAARGGFPLSTPVWGEATPWCTHRADGFLNLRGEDEPEAEDAVRQQTHEEHHHHRAQHHHHLQHVPGVCQDKNKELNRKSNTKNETEVESNEWLFLMIYLIIHQKTERIQTLCLWEYMDFKQQEFEYKYE